MCWLLTISPEHLVSVHVTHANAHIFLQGLCIENSHYITEKTNETAKIISERFHWLFGVQS